MGGIQRVEYFSGKDGLWYWRVRAANGEVILSSEGHVNKQDALAIARESFPDIEPVEVTP